MEEFKKIVERIDDSTKSKTQSSSVDDRGIVLQSVCLKNSTSRITVDKWAYGVAFRNDPTNLVKEMSAVAPKSDECDNVGIDKCAYIKVVQAWLSNGQQIQGGPVQAPANQCFSVIVWEVVEQPSALDEDGNSEYKLVSID